MTNETWVALQFLLIIIAFAGLIALGTEIYNYLKIKKTKDYLDDQNRWFSNMDQKNKTKLKQDKKSIRKN